MRRRTAPGDRRAPAPAPDVPASRGMPTELVQHILLYSIELDQMAVQRVLCVSRAWYRILVPYVYTRVQLGSSEALLCFADLVRRKPEVARAVRRLWIGPRHARSDLLALLSLPMPSDSDYVQQRREQVYVQTRAVLRACRRLDDVALSGSLVAADLVHSYGTACQPRRLTSINPHSFISGFDAPIFRRVHTLTLCDVNLSLSEARAIRQMPSLHTFYLTAPKNYGDPAKDAAILRSTLTSDNLLDRLAHMRLEDTPPLRWCVRGPIERAQRMAESLAALLDDDVLVQIDYEALPPTFCDEWDALRDRLFHALDEEEATCDPSEALAFLEQEWRFSIPMRSLWGPAAIPR
ncbi:hypothetical protein MEQU1_003379 [Malassezia equina]|uniref:F-box domain-containing protein n=1 Tax=Malassezia equina TaxID=1381935 RepID=A0AAF0EL17_9BASI|nr:hypothetical protein MEQU1_003379 [Malassezia equina]